ncbi:MAG TPA: SLATT domain-containing protein [Longimicrobiales bacterium]
MSTTTAARPPQTQPRSPRRRRDLECSPLEGLSWKPSEVEASLSAVFQHVRDDALEAIEWYQRARKPKRLLAVSTRTLAIASFGAAAALPLIAPLASATIDRLWMALVIAIAGGALAVDRFLDGTSGWIRCMKTEQQLRDELEAFELEWEFGRAALQGQSPNLEQTIAMLQRAKAFAAHVNTVVQTETNAWVEEFQSSIKQLDEALRSRTADTREREERRRGSPIFAVPVTSAPGAPANKSNELIQEVNVP